MVSPEIICIPAKLNRFVQQIVFIYLCICNNNKEKEDMSLRGSGGDKGGVGGKEKGRVM